MECLIKIYRVFFGCKRYVIKTFFDEEEIHDKISPCNLPWIWIGGTDKEGNVITITEEVNERIQHGDFVNVLFLDGVAGTENVKWKYLTPTLEEKDFPYAGFVIDNELNNAVYCNE